MTGAISDRQFNDVFKRLKSALSSGDFDQATSAISDLKIAIYDGNPYSDNQRDQLGKILIEARDAFDNDIFDWQTAVMLISHLRTPENVYRTIELSKRLGFPEQLMSPSLDGVRLVLLESKSDDSFRARLADLLTAVNTSDASNEFKSKVQRLLAESPKP